jgi:hypothetical protein
LIKQKLVRNFEPYETLINLIIVFVHWLCYLFNLFYCIEKSWPDFHLLLVFHFNYCLINFPLCSSNLILLTLIIK